MAGAITYFLGCVVKFLEPTLVQVFKFVELLQLEFGFLAAQPSIPDNYQNGIAINFIKLYPRRVVMLLDKLPLEKKLQLIGEVAILMMNSSIHKHYRVGDISNIIIPALHLNQFRIYRIGEQPVGFVSWAYLSDKIEKKYTSSPMLLKLSEWKSGNNLFFIDFIAPFGHARKIIQDLKTNIFPDKTVAKALRFKEVGKLQKIATYYGKNVSRKNLLNNQEINFELIGLTHQ